MEFTLSVRSFHTPLAPSTSAWPPNFPSVPTSRATRVTSEVNTPICAIISLTTVAERRNSPLSGRPSASRRMLCVRSPLATAVMVRVTSAVGHSRSSMSVLTEDSISPHAPVRRSLDDAHARLAFLADHLPGALELRGQALVRAHHFIEGIGDLAGESGLVRREAHAEIAVAHRLQRAQQFLEIEFGRRGVTATAIAVGDLGLGRLRRAAARRRSASACGNFHGLPGFLRVRQSLNAIMRGTAPHNAVGLR